MSTLWMNFCVGTWSFFAQVAPSVTPGASPAAAATTAPIAPAAPASAAPIVPSAAPAVHMTPVGTQTVDPSQIINQVPPEQSHTFLLSAFHGAALFLYFVLCIALVTCVTFCTTKSEGLGGVIGGTTSTTIFKGKKSSEELLSLWTGRLAVAFIVASLFIWLLFGRHTV